MNRSPFINALKPYVGEEVIAIDSKSVITGQLFMDEGDYGIGNPMRPNWIFSPREIESVTPISTLNTAVIRICDKKTKEVTE